MKKICIRSDKKCIKLDVDEKINREVKDDGVNKSINILSLPSDIIINIIIVLEFTDFANIAYVCKYYNTISRNKRNKRIWAQQFENMKKKIDLIIESADHQRKGDYLCRIYNRIKGSANIRTDVYHFVGDLSNIIDVFNKVQILYCNIALLIFNLRNQLGYFKRHWINNYNFKELLNEGFIINVKMNCSKNCRSRCIYRLDRFTNLDVDRCTNLDVDRYTNLDVDRSTSCDTSCYGKSINTNGLISLCYNHFQLYKQSKLKINNKSVYGDSCRNEECSNWYYSDIYDSKSIFRYKHCINNPGDRSKYLNFFFNLFNVKFGINSLGVKFSNSSTNYNAVDIYNVVADYLKPPHISDDVYVDVNDISGIKMSPKKSKKSSGKIHNIKMLDKAVDGKVFSVTDNIKVFDKGIDDVKVPSKEINGIDDVKVPSKEINGIKMFNKYTHYEKYKEYYQGYAHCQTHAYINDSMGVCEFCGKLNRIIPYPIDGFPFAIMSHPLNRYNAVSMIYLCDGECAWNLMLKFIDYYVINSKKYVMIPCVYTQKHTTFHGRVLLSKDILSLRDKSPFLLTEKCVVVNIYDKFDHDYISQVHKIYSLTHQSYCNSNGCWTYLPQSFIL